ncbi:MAG TPA: peptide MFS transporter [Bryobacteraceae bacterium]|nr:peptide MFS transporter [Bryobacteraceae bacterium]
MPSHTDTAFFGHPSGLSTLFFTEMWERFSYYGMRALLILFMTAAVTEGGLGMSTADAGVIYGLVTAMVYMAALPGGWIADQFLGLRKAVLYGGILIAIGNFCLVIPTMSAFYGGLAVIVVGTGLLKPNVSAIVGQLYTPTDARRDAGFSIFYMGINTGALLAPFACGWIAQYNWRYGFGLAGIGMTIGLIQYTLGGRRLGDAGVKPAGEGDPAQSKRRLMCGLGTLSITVLITVMLAVMGVVSAKDIADASGLVLLIVVIAFFGWLLFSAQWTPVERKRLIVIAGLFVAAAIFWSVFEQAGSTLNLFAERSTANRILGYEYPAPFYQSVNSIFLVLLAPVFAWVWVRLGPKEPSSPAKFALGLLLVGAGFLVLAIGATAAASGVKVSPTWLVLTYLCHTMGELCLSPVGLSAMTKLAPASVTGLMMGVWFLALSVGNYMGGRMASMYETLPLQTLFIAVGAFAIVAGIVLAMFVRPMVRLMGGVR